MKAIEDDNIIMCSDFCLRGGGNTVGLAFFAKWLHPDLFEDFDAFFISTHMIFGQYDHNVKMYEQFFLYNSNSCAP